MYNQFITVTTLFALSACSTEFEVQDGEVGEEPTVESTPEQTEIDLENADVSSMALSRVIADSEYQFENIDENSALTDNVMPISPEEGMSVSPEEGMSVSPEDATPIFPINAMNVKRVENELQIRMFPAKEAYVKVCTYGTTIDCFSGKTLPMDNMDAAEILIDLRSAPDAKAFSIKFKDNETIYQPTDRIRIPSTENIWKEVMSCDPKLKLEQVAYDLFQSSNGDFARLKFYSDTLASAMICGLDESGDNICLWEELNAGYHKLMLPVDVGVDAMHSALIRDKKGCSIQLDINP